MVQVGNTMRRWQYFLPAAFFGGYLLLSNGVPWLPVLAGIAIAGASVWLRSKQAK